MREKDGVVLILEGVGERQTTLLLVLINDRVHIGRIEIQI